MIICLQQSLETAIGELQNKKSKKCGLFSCFTGVFGRKRSAKKSKQKGGPVDNEDIPCSSNTGIDNGKAASKDMERSENSQAMAAIPKVASDDVSASELVTKDESVLGMESVEIEAARDDKNVGVPDSVPDMGDINEPTIDKQAVPDVGLTVTVEQPTPDNVPYNGEIPSIIITDETGLSTSL